MNSETYDKTLAVIVDEVTKYLTNAQAPDGCSATPFNKPALVLGVQRAFDVGVEYAEERDKELLTAVLKENHLID